MEIFILISDLIKRAYSSLIFLLFLCRLQTIGLDAQNTKRKNFCSIFAKTCFKRVDGSVHDLSLVSTMMLTAADMETYFKRGDGSVHDLSLVSTMMLTAAYMETYFKRGDGSVYDLSLVSTMMLTAADMENQDSVINYYF